MLNQHVTTWAVTSTAQWADCFWECLFSSPEAPQNSGEKKIIFFQIDKNSCAKMPYSCCFQISLPPIVNNDHSLNSSWNSMCDQLIHSCIGAAYCPHHQCSEGNVFCKQTWMGSFKAKQFEISAECSPDLTSADLYHRGDSRIRTSNFIKWIMYRSHNMTGRSSAISVFFADL